jgi:hypothetical protein
MGHGLFKKYKGLDKKMAVAVSHSKGEKGKGYIYTLSLYYCDTIYFITYISNIVNYTVSQKYGFLMRRIVTV